MNDVEYAEKIEYLRLLIGKKGRIFLKTSFRWLLKQERDAGFNKNNTVTWRERELSGKKVL